MTLDAILDAVGELEIAVSKIPAGDPGLAGLLARIDALEKEVADARGMAQPLVPESAPTPSTAQNTADNIHRALVSLRHAAESKRPS